MTRGHLHNKVSVALASVRLTSHHHWPSAFDPAFNIEPDRSDGLECRRAITRAEVHLRNERHDSGLESIDQAGGA